jgi:hypothetical protein
MKVDNLLEEQVDEYIPTTMDDIEAYLSIDAKDTE